MNALIVKVQCGDSLRRFRARVNDNYELDLDMARLEAKILSFFNIPDDVDFTLKYYDEDNHLVTLVDDDDLRDVMLQYIKFLWIEVHISDDIVVGESDDTLSNTSHVDTGPKAVAATLPAPVCDMGQITRASDTLKSPSAFPEEDGAKEKASILKPPSPMLYSRFIGDDKATDWTIVAPSAAFTKICRVENNGTTAWQKGTRLLWVGGTKLAGSGIVDLEIPEDGLPAGKELDIKVELIAPQTPGRYISYWIMLSPSGQTFGQRIRLNFKVESCHKNLISNSNPGLPWIVSNFDSGSEAPQVPHISTQTQNSTAATEPVKKKEDEPTNKSSFDGQSTSLNYQTLAVHSSSSMGFQANEYEIPKALLDHFSDLLSANEVHDLEESEYVFPKIPFEFL